MPLLGQDNSWTRQRHAISMRNKHCYHRDYHHVFSFPIQVLLTDYRDTRKSNLTSSDSIMSNVYFHAL